jgi:hypothetical protein
MKILLIGVLGFGLLALAYRWILPISRAGLRSELLMLGDFDEDHRWTAADLAAWDQLAANPFAGSSRQVQRADLNGNGLLDPEDRELLASLARSGDPYKAEAEAVAAERDFPRPREFYRYLRIDAWVVRPTYALAYPGAATSALPWLRSLVPVTSRASHLEGLMAQVFEESVRLDLAYRQRNPALTPVERAYADRKLQRCDELARAGRWSDLLLNIIALVEDAETLGTKEQEPLVARTLFIRDRLKGILASPMFAEFRQGRRQVSEVLQEVEKALREEAGIDVKLETLPPPRELTHLQNYLDRAEWQYYKTRVPPETLQRLVDFAQHDSRYLRAVARTSKPHQDSGVENHDLPMELLFREALCLTNGNKKAAVGLLDEAIRIPFAWIKSLPPKALPGSLALENFLLPGNKEDGADKSRHWNVFGGICLYKSPRAALDLALRREMKDLREANYSAEAMTEFLRDTIANLNGMYYVVSMDPYMLYPDVGP